jgi:hypothetical protein
MALSFLISKRSLLEENVHVYACMLVRSDAFNTHTFGICRCSLECVHICVSNICIWYMHAPLNGYIFLSHGVSNVCILYVQVGYIFPESWCLKHMHLVCAKAKS